MITVDSPESPDISPDGRLVAFSAAQRHHQRHLHGQSRHQGDRQPHEGRVRRLRADLGAGRQVDRLSQARERQREAVPARSRVRQVDAAHLRHARRRRRAVPRRQHAGVHVDGDRSGEADRSRRREERRHSQRVDARPAQRRAAAVHRRARRQLHPGRPPRPTRRRRASAFVTFYKGEYGLHTLDKKEPVAKAATADFGAPGPGHRLPGADDAHRSSPRTRRRRASSRRCSSTAARRWTSA